MPNENPAVFSAPILIVDDNPGNVRLLEAILESGGYTNLTGTTDARIVEQLAAATNFDLLVLDLNMPYLDGFEVLERLAARIRDDYLPVLVLTAMDDRETRLKALRLGAKDFLTKPYDAEEVLMRVRNMLDVRLLYNERRREAQVLEEEVRRRTQDLRRQAEELMRVQIQTIHCLGRAGKFRSAGDTAHVQRMGKISRLLAAALGLDADHAAMMELAAPLHDLGNIGISDEILSMPGRLTPDEFRQMQRHTEIGATILGDYPSELFAMAKAIALTHHEKWDGSGYPNGLVGEAIPLEGRIVAVVDVFDALMSERPYKRPWTVLEAVGYINQQSGKHFDPRVVEAFNAHLPQFLEIRERFGGAEPMAA